MNVATQEKPQKIGRARRRRAARQVALQLTYAYDQKRFADDGNLATEDVINLDSEGQLLANHIFAGLCRERTAVDATVDKRLNNWTLDRMAVIDRSLLRLGCYELLYEAATPSKVIINEYIELAKIFGSEDRTPKLVNGVLDTIARDHRPT